jgi:hypothetical protein
MDSWTAGAGGGGEFEKADAAYEPGEAEETSVVLLVISC